MLRIQRFYFWKRKKGAGSPKSSKNQPLTSWLLSLITYTNRNAGDIFPLEKKRYFAAISFLGIIKLITCSAFYHHGGLLAYEELLVPLNGRINSLNTYINLWTTNVCIRLAQYSFNRSAVAVTQIHG